MDRQEQICNTLAPTPRALDIYQHLHTQFPETETFFTQLLQKHPEYHELASDFLLVFERLASGFQAQHRLFLCGNGGSFSDAMHISGELLKSFKLRRPLSNADQARFAKDEFSEVLRNHLEYGLPCIVLGLNHSLSSALQNDCSIAEIQYAQELYALGQPGDMLLAVSTSGNAQNVLYAVATAKAVGMSSIGLTGRHGGKLAQCVDIAIHAPERSTETIQEHHVAIYHALCAMLESRFFTHS